MKYDLKNLERKNSYVIAFPKSLYRDMFCNMKSSTSVLNKAESNSSSNLMVNISPKGTNPHEQIYTHDSS